MNIDDLTLGQIKEMRAMLGGTCATSSPLADNGQRVIAILDRGWVVAGLWQQDGSRCVVREASVVRRWGTTRGLGELALKGPLKDTKLDPCGEVRVPLSGVVGLMPCSDKWVS